MRRGMVGVLVVLVAVGAVDAGIATAAQVSSDGGVIRFQAAAGEANRVTVDAAPDGGVSFVDDGAAMVAGAGCSDPGDGSLSCSRAGVTSVVVDVGDGDDTLTAGTVGLPLQLLGGPATTSSRARPAPTASTAATGTTPSTVATAATW